MGRFRAAQRWLLGAARSLPGAARSLPGALRSVSARTSLRTKLVASLLVLVTAALAVIDFASITQLKQYLVGRADAQLYQQSTRITSQGVIPRSTGLQIATRMAGFVYNQRGQLLSYVFLDEPNVSLPVNALWLSENVNRYTTIRTADGESWRTYTTTGIVNDPASGNTITVYLVMASDLSEVYQTVSRLTGADIIVSAAIIFVLGVIGYALVAANLRPLVEIEETAGDIAEGHMNRRVVERDTRTEVGSLGRSLNMMLDQIETAFHQQERSEEAARRSEERMRRFVADASHELRTPLTAIRGFAEYYRQRGSGQDLSPEDLSRIMNRVEAEAARMGLLVEDLLLLARMDQQRPLAQAPVDMLTLAADAVHDARMLAPDRTIALDVQPGAAFLVTGDEARLRQVIGNLMNNALTHTPAGTPVTVSIGAGKLHRRSEVPAVVVKVADEGPGMTVEQANRVFERFYRADPARTRARGGSGLGLAIVRALVEAHGGVVSVRTAPGAGATFRVALPLAPEAAGPGDDVA